MRSCACPARPAARASRTADQRRKVLGRAISKNIGRAIGDYDMIRDKDKILVAVSGGKDSLTLLKILTERQAIVPVRYTLVPVHVDLGYACADVDGLKEYLGQEGHDLLVQREAVLKDKVPAQVTCFWCAWSRRKVLFRLADEFGCNKLALGHHKDDIAETILMNLLFNGEISAMVPHQKLFKGKLSIIRPLAYVEEDDIRRYAGLWDFPALDGKCPNASVSQRAFVKEWIRQAERVAPGVKTNVLRSLQRIKADYLLSDETTSQ
jgi:tRNA 2-thiocytidine biosynthesis protein TtcA